MTLDAALQHDLSARVRTRALEALREPGRVEAVSADGDRVTYRVRSGDAEYLVGLPADEDRAAPVACDCQAGKNDRLCYHLVAAVAVHFREIKPAPPAG